MGLLLKSINTGYIQSPKYANTPCDIPILVVIPTSTQFINIDSVAAQAATKIILPPVFQLSQSNFMTTFFPVLSQPTHKYLYRSGSRDINNS